MDHLVENKTSTRLKWSILVRSKNEEQEVNSLSFHLTLKLGDKVLGR